MQDFDAKWITNKEFCAFEPINVFHKENDDVKIPGNAFRRTIITSCTSTAALSPKDLRRAIRFIIITMKSM